MQLNKTYDKEKFNDFLAGFLPDDFILSEKDLVIGSNYKSIKSGLVLGESKSLGVKVFYLEHEKEKDPRVALTTEAFKILSENWSKKALVVFNSKNSENWRFSLMTVLFDINEKNKIISNLSNPKRKSFFLGPNAKIATANQFLFNKGRVKNFEDLESRFDVEVVTKEFFNNYKKLYTKLLDYLKNDKAFNVFAIKHGLELEIFGKKLLGQIVFIYFLQKKGWLGARKGDNISNGDKTFLRNIFEKCKQGNNNFFNDYLEHLFYDCLNRIPERDGSFYREKFDCQIPFLNGGLFEPINYYDWKNKFIDISNDIFSNKENDGILDVFDLYNFTIDENTPNDQEISVDPEMLGKVFENLLESNTRKGQGAFYTPREIVHYMCRESLVNYLATNHSNLSEENIRNYINYGDSLNKGIAELGKNWKGESFAPGQFNELNELLKNIKVVDPACGSGAFLVGMLQEIVRLRTFLQLTPDSELFSKSNNSIKELTAYDLKKETIQNCLYGVDIDPGAIDIAKLRFWLSIVVEENIEDIEPLPNLDYKIMQGNSLLEDLVIGDSVIPLKFEGKKKIDGRTKEKKDLFIESHQAKLFIDESEALVEKLERYHTEYFNITDPDKKKILKKKIDGVEDELIQSKCNEEIERADSFIKNNPNDSNKILKYTEKILAIKEVLRKWKIDHLRPFFPWKLHFGEVFNRESEGFNIVIGNPPYIRHRDLEKQFKDILKNLYLTGNTTSDIYCYFYELSFKLLSSEGVSAFITSNKWMGADYGNKLRAFFKNNTSVESLIDLGSGQFSSVVVDTNILLFKKKKPVTNHKIKYGIKIPQPKEDLEEILQIELNDSAFSFLNQKEILLRQKIEDAGIKLSDWDNLKINYGVLTGKNEIKTSAGKEGVFIIDEDKKDELIKRDSSSRKLLKPILRGKDINKYYHSWDNKYLVAMYYGMHKKVDDFPAIKEHIIKYCEILKSRAQVKRGDHHWMELDQNPSERYMAEFSEDKILYPVISSGPSFCYDDSKYFHNDKVFHIVGDNLKYLLACLNSKLLYWIIKLYGPTLGSNGFEFRKIFVEKLPVPWIESAEQKPFIELVDKILEITKAAGYVDNIEKQNEVREYEKQIDQMVYKLYDLTPEEIEIVETSSKKL
jgi:type I restriction-modification system DNA methylase subunit